MSRKTRKSAVYNLEFDGGDLYIGMSSKLPRRLSTHRRAARRYAGHLNFQVVAVFLGFSRREAFRFERYLINSLRPSRNQI